jgi:hypothetical protein
MRLFVFGLAACVAVGLAGWAPGVRADEPYKKDKPKGDPAKEFAKLDKDFKDAQQAFFKAYREAKTNEERQQAIKDKQPKVNDYADRFSKLAETYPNSPEATQALGWLVANARGTEAGNKALEKLKEKLASIDDLDLLDQILKHVPGFAVGDLVVKISDKVKKNLDHPKASSILMWVCSATLYGGGGPLGKLYDTTVDLVMEKFPDRQELAPLADWLPIDQNPEWAEKHLRTLMEKNPSEEVKTKAKFGLATVLQNKDEASQPEAEKIFQAFADGTMKGPDLANQAKEHMSEMKVRGIGKPAPEIAGNDLDDKEFKLSDYKGKVVLIDFWGFW